MNNTEFMNESFDLKRLFLCFKQKIYLIIIMSLAGAILGGGIYLIVRMITMPTLYESRSQFYLQYIYDPSGEVEQYYNGYTWNDLLHGDPVLNHVVTALESFPYGEKILDGKPNTDEGYKERLRDNNENKFATIKGAILSDRRLLTVIFTTEKQGTNSIIQEAMEIGLLNYAAGQSEIISMELIRSTDPQLLIWDNHLSRAIITSAVLFLLLASFGWWFYYILDDSLYTTADAEKRYPYPVLGVLLKGETMTDEKNYFTELKENLAFLIKDNKNFKSLSVENLPYPEAADLRKADGIILEIPFGGRNSKLTDRCVSFMKNQEINILGLIITEADEKFIKSYYKGNCK